MSDVKDVELTEVNEVKRGETLLEATEARENLEAVLNRLMGDSNSLKKLEDEFTADLTKAFSIRDKQEIEIFENTFTVIRDKESSKKIATVLSKMPEGKETQSRGQPIRE